MASPCSASSATDASLVAAEARARQLFDECIRRGLVVPGKREQALSDEIADLARELFGVRRYWHKRIVRAGRNTLLPYADNPLDLAIAADDVVFLDLGPVFDDWEADLGATIAVGSDPRKHQLVADLERGWQLAAAHFRAHAEITGAELYAFVGDVARQLGWEIGHVHCGHLIGRFPHERVEGDDALRYLCAGNPLPMRRAGVAGPLRWILEMHFVDRAAGFGGFQESLLLESAAR